LTIEVLVTGLQEARAAFERGRNVIVVAPPAVEHSDPVWDLIGANGEASRPGTIIMCTDAAAATSWSEHPRSENRVHAVTGLTRTQRLLAAHPPQILAGGAKDLAALVARSALKLSDIRTVVLAWLEDLAPDEQQRLIDPLLADAATARRIVLTWSPGRAGGLIERHAFRAPMVGRPDLDPEGRPAPPAGPARFALIARERAAVAARAATDALGAVRPLVWRRGLESLPETADAVICVDLPNREEFARVSTLGQPLLLVSAAQLPYVRTLASPVVPFPLPGAADLALDRAEELRNELATLLQHQTLDAELAMLGPLFESYDPGQVAAALLALNRRTADSNRQPSGIISQSSGAGPATSRLFINVGKKDRATAKDIVGALIREAGLSKEEIGRIELRDTFSLVDVVEGATGRAMRLAGATVKGRRVTVRMDRHA
jgi:hypothetical protein